MIMLYYGGLALGRFVSGVVGSKLHSWKIVRIGQGILGCGIIAMILPFGIVPAAVGLFLVGFGNGPLFPNLLYLTPEFFGEEKSTSVIGTQMAVSSLASMTAPILCGLLGQRFGMMILPFYLLVFFAVMVSFGLLANSVLWKKTGRK